MEQLSKTGGKLSVLGATVEYDGWNPCSMICRAVIWQQYSSKIKRDIFVQQRTIDKLLFKISIDKCRYIFENCLKAKII